MEDIPKPIKREMRILAERIYEAAQNRELEALSESFDEWKANKIDCWDLTETIHKFHNGASRDLWKIFVDPDPRFRICYGVNYGLIGIADIPAEVMPYVERLLSVVYAPET